MTVLSILSCKILQDEIIWLIANDSQINRIVIVANGNISEFIEKLDELHTCYDIVRSKSYHKPLIISTRMNSLLSSTLWNLDFMQYQKY